MSALRSLQTHYVFRALCTKEVTLERAQAMIVAACQKAEEIGVAQNIAIVDEGNNLVAFARMNGAWLGSINIAQNKAFTARALNISTKVPRRNVTTWRTAVWYSRE
jgi:uncharacterized protein GlcG (DUF336 family)